MKNLRDPIRRRILTVVGNYLALKHQIIRKFEGEAPLGRHRRLVLFAHFDPQGVIDPYVVNYVTKLAELGADIIFVSSSPRLAIAEAHKVAPYCARIIHRRNVGLDFGSWRIAFEEIKERAREYDQIVLTNDSVYGPLRDLKIVFAEMAGQKLDLWGITDSLEQHYHLQSYFLVFNSRLIQDGYFESIWENFEFHWSKAWIINQYELGTTGRALSRLAKVGALISAVELRTQLLAGSDQFQYRAELEERHLNPTLYFWEQLVTRFGSPFLKTEMLKMNRLGSGNLKKWRDVVGATGYFDPRLIENHLRRTQGQAP